MKRCSLFCAGWWRYLLIMLALLLLVLFFKWNSIEKDVAANASANLNAAELTWAGVENYNRGREVLINGTAPNQASVDNALSVVRIAEGVNSAKFVGDIKVMPLAQPSLSITVEDDKVMLSGTVANQATIESLVTRANQSYGAANIINQLRLGENTAALPDMNNIFGVLRGVKSSSVMNLRDGKMTLTGEVESQEIKTNIGDNVARIFSGPIDNRLSVSAPVVDVVEPIAEVVAPVAAPVPVDRSICQNQVNELLSTGKINFQTGRAAVKEDSNALLDSIADIAEKCSEARFEVAGHTDSTGRLESNNRLSKQRAQAVVDYLVKQGLDASQFDAAGYGPSQPVGDNATSEGRAQNRRIEFKLIN